MRNSSELAKDILCNKEFSELSPCDNFVPFLVQKYISGVHPAYCNLINDLTNNKLLTWNDSQEIYDLFKCVIPKKSDCGYRYFGGKNEHKEYKIDLESISNNLEISIKEFKEMLEYFPDLEKNLKEDKEKILKLKK